MTAVHALQSIMQTSKDPIEDAILSIFGFLQRTAESTTEGRVWETIDYQNRPHRDLSVFNGVGGISFFLVDAFRRYQDSAMLDLAQGAIDWCAAFSGRHYQRGLQFGKTGPALAALHKAIALDQPDVPEFCLINAGVILREPPGPITDLIGGAASNGLFLLKLWARTGDNIHLRGAERCAAWLELQMRRDERGTHCVVDPESRLGFGPQIYLGVAHGLAGIAHFLACLAEATRNDRWATLSRDLFDTIARYALPAHGGSNWAVHLESSELNRCQWSHGAAGIGLTFLTAHRVLGDARFLDLALQAAEATWGYGDFRHNYTQCIGLAGSGELLLETYRATGDARWLDRARAFAHLALAYKESTPHGDAWPTDTPGLHSADFSYGAAGAGHFFLRVLSGGTIPLPLM